MGSLVLVGAAIGGLVLYARSEVARRGDERERAQVSRTSPRLREPDYGAAHTGGARAFAELGVLTDYDWTLEDLDGRRVSFTRFRGRALFVTYWATWCAPCVAELPTISALHRGLAGSRMEFIMISDEDHEPVARFVERNDVALPTYLVREGLPSVLWAKVRPTTFIVGCDGRVALRHVGAADWGTDTTRRFVEQVLADTCG